MGEAAKEIEMGLPGMTEAKILEQMQDAVDRAWEALSGYKFWMFGYHAGRWVNYNRLLPTPQANPFRPAVALARSVIAGEGR